MASGQQPREPSSFFDEKAGWYDDAYERENADGHALRARMEAVLEAIGTGPGEVLDAGMGPGRLCAELARRGWTVSGIDAAEAMVEAARRRLPESSEHLVRGEIESLPYADASFDCVAATGVIEYSDVPQALAEIARVLRLGGRAVVSYPNPYAQYVFWKSRAYYPLVRVAKRLFRRRSLPPGSDAISRRHFEQLLRSVGLEPTATRPTAALLLPSPLDAALPRFAASLGRRFEGHSPFWLATQLVFSARKPG